MSDLVKDTADVAGAPPYIPSIGADATASALDAVPSLLLNRAGFVSAVDMDFAMRLIL